MTAIIPTKSFVINLDRRQDRLQAFSDMYDLAGFPSDWPRPVKYRAVDGSVLGAPEGFESTPGAFGCGRSHANLISDFLHDCLQDETLAVFEDDAIVCEAFKERLPIFLASIPNDWDCILLGAEFKCNTIVPLNKEVVKVKKCTRTTFYLARKSFLRELFKAWANSPTHIDRQWHGALEKHNVYCPHPENPLIGQRAGYSDVQSDYKPKRDWSSRAYVL